MAESFKYLEALLQNNSRVINEIYDTIFYKVKSYIIKNGGKNEDAEDVFQKALIQLAVRYKKEKFVINTSFEAYLFTVCKNLWRRELNKEKNRVTNLDVVNLKDESGDVAFQILEQKRWELFSECLEQISENCKNVLKLYFSKTPYSKMVKMLKYSSETVARQRVFKCKNKLKQIISKDNRFETLKEL